MRFSACTWSFPDYRAWRPCAHLAGTVGGPASENHMRLLLLVPKSAVCVSSAKKVSSDAANAPGRAEPTLDLRICVATSEKASFRPDQVRLIYVCGQSPAQVRGSFQWLPSVQWAFHVGPPAGLNVTCSWSWLRLRSLSVSLWHSMHNSWICILGSFLFWLRFLPLPPPMLREMILCLCLVIDFAFATGCALLVAYHYALGLLRRCVVFAWVAFPQRNE